MACGPFNENCDFTYDTLSVTSSEPSQEDFQNEEYEKQIIDKIKKVKEEVDKIHKEVTEMKLEELANKLNIYEELFIQKTLVLDSLEIRNSMLLKKLRKETIMYIQECQKSMDTKIHQYLKSTVSHI